MKKKILLTGIHVMKMSLYAILINGIFISIVFAGGVDAQNTLKETYVRLDLKNENLLNTFMEIEHQTDFEFSYDHNILLEDFRINLSDRHISVAKALAEVAKQTNLRFRRVNKSIDVRMASKNAAIPQVEEVTVDKNISGKVKDETGEPIPGANVVVKNTTIGTITDANGEFSLQIPDDATTLVFSYVGMNEEEVEIGNRTFIEISMIPDIQSLEEIVVIGYGEVKRSDLTGSVATITNQDIREIPTNTVSQLFQGRAAGVQVTTGDAAPGGGINIRIRGTSTITGSTEPLYIIDGFPVNSDNDDLYVTGGFNENDGGPSRGNSTNKVRPNALSFINPNDIESIEILKDAAATAIYGNRGANGVIIITTKRGEVGKTKVNVNYSFGSQSIVKKIVRPDGPEWVARLTEAEINAGVAPEFVRYNGSDEFHPLAENAETHDWQDILYRTAPVHDLAVNFTGGTENTKYLFSAKYYDQEGTMVGSGYQDLQTRLNLDQNIADVVALQSNLLLSHNVNERVPTGAGFNYNAVQQALGYSPAINPDWFDTATGLWYTDPKTSGPNVYTNPLRLIEGIHDEIATNRLLGNILAKVKILESLKFTASYGIDYYDANREIYIDRTLVTAGSPTNNGEASINKVISTRTNANAYFTWNQSFDKHNLNAVIGVERVKQINSNLNVSIADFATDDLKTDNIAGGNSDNLRAGNGKTQWQSEGYFGRINYNYANKYYVSINARYDGSSVFGIDNKWKFFPSAAFAWKPTEETFLQGQEILSDLKVRLSVGQVGNGNIPAYSSQGLWTIRANRYSYGNGELVNGAALSRIQNDELQWETTTQYNLGFDARFLGGRLGFTFDYYLKNTDDLILDVVIPKSSGFKSSRQNIGSLRNTGLEFSTDYVIYDGEFHWDLNANLTFLKSEATDVGEGTTIDPNTGEPYIEVSEWQRRGGLRLYEGQPAGEIYGFVIEGVFDNQEQADNWPVDMNADRSLNQAGYWIYKDINGDGIVTEDDQTSLGTGQPDMIFGVTNRFRYKAFDLSLFIQGVTGANIVQFYGGDSDDPFYSDFWTPENQDAEVAINTTGTNGYRFLRFDNRQVQNGNYVRLKNVRLGYTVPTQNIGFLSGLNLYVNVSNLLTITGYDGYNPDVSSGGTSPFSQGFDTGVYPLARTFTFGLNANF